MRAIWVQRAGVALSAILLAACTNTPDGTDTDAQAQLVALEPSEPFAEVRALKFVDQAGLPATLSVWVADTPERRALGLMNRRVMPIDVGMLFIFPQDHTGGFWMKDTRIPLSIAYLAADGTIVSILDMQPCTADPCPTYDPGAPYRYAVEANLGWFSARGIAVGYQLAGLAGSSTAS